SETAVWGAREGVMPDIAVERLGVAPRRRPGGGVPGVADGEVPGEGGEGLVVEDVRNEAHVLHDGDRLSVAHRHARGLLATMLDRVEAEVGEVRHGLVRRVDP